jgi:hypothetical protein
MTVDELTLLQRVLKEPQRVTKTEYESALRLLDLEIKLKTMDPRKGPDEWKEKT